MSASLTAVVLLAALLHAVWNALVKSSPDRLLQLTALNVAAGIVALPLVPVVGLPGKAALPFLLGTMLIHCSYYAFLLLSYARGGLSLVYPIARGSSPIFVAAASGSLLGESLDRMQWLGVASITVGIASLAFAGGRRGLSPRAVLLSLATGLSIAAYTMVDGTGARAAATPSAYIVSLFVLNALPMLVVLPISRRGVALERLRAQWKTAALGGVFSFFAYGLAIWAMSRGAIALVAALRETSVVIAAAIGATFLREPFGRARVIASVGVTLGIVVLRLTS